MLSEWLRVMLEEIARKNADAEQAQLELARRREDQDDHRARDDRAEG